MMAPMPSALLTGPAPFRWQWRHVAIGGVVLVGVAALLWWFLNRKGRR
jgi:hypothetical protein